MKVFAYYLLGLLMRGVFLLAGLVPERALVYCFKRGAVLYVRSSHRYRERIFKNLKLAFGPSYSSRQIEACMDGLASHLGMSVVEMKESSVAMMTGFMSIGGSGHWTI